MVTIKYLNKSSEVLIITAKHKVNVIVPTIENGEQLCVRLCLVFFPTQNQVPQLMIGLGRAIYQIKAQCREKPV